MCLEEFYFKKSFQTLFQQSGLFSLPCYKQSAFQQVFASLPKAQLNMESFQQLRKIYGDLECQYCGKMTKVCFLLCEILTPTQNVLIYSGIVF